MLYPDKKPSFYDIFVTYCDINNIQVATVHKEIINIIISQQYSSLVTFHKWGFLWYYFDELLKEEISFEQFMTMGDIEGQIEDQINPHIYQEEHPPVLGILTPEKVSLWTKDTLVILDPLVISYYTHLYGEMITPGHIIILDVN